MQSSDQIKQAIENYLAGNASESERQLIDEWYNSFDDKVVNVNTDGPDYFDLAAARIKARVQESLELQEVQKTKTIRLWPFLTAAASIILCIGIGFYFYEQQNLGQSHISHISANKDIFPGGNKAFLTLADGKRITLTDAKNGELAEQSGVKITKTADGQLIYTVSKPSNGNNRTDNYNTIETPRGGTYQVCLPDGTKVWLNAASTLRFPSSFARLVNRRVELLSGEAYFEVTKDKKHPFIVKTDQQEVEVLGTHFNINNYSDELSTKTTLIEGLVRISLLFKNQKKVASKILKPDEQAVFDGENLRILDIDADEAIAWKQGLFKFEDADVKAVFRQLSRWYDMDIIYENDVKSYRFTGEISKSLNLSEALSGLQFIGLKFKVEGKRIVVANK